MSSALRQAEETERRPPPYEWDYDQPSLRVMWGRVLALAILLIGIYVVGRITAPPTASVGEVDRLETELAAAQDRIAALERTIDDPAAAASTESSGSEVAQAESQGGGEPAADGKAVTEANQNSAGGAKEDAGDKAAGTGTQAGDTAAGPSGGGGSGGGDSSTEVAETYTVQSGDSLNLIAANYYGDPSLVKLIKRANGIRQAGDIRIGDTIKLPPPP